MLVISDALIPLGIFIQDAFPLSERDLHGRQGWIGLLTLVPLEWCVSHGNNYDFSFQPNNTYPSLQFPLLHDPRSGLQKSWNSLSFERTLPNCISEALGRLKVLFWDFWHMSFPQEYNSASKAHTTGAHNPPIYQIPTLLLISSISPHMPPIQSTNPPLTHMSSQPPPPPYEAPSPT